MRKKMKESMTIKEKVTSGVEVNDDLNPSVVFELCNNNSNKNNEIPNLKHIESFIELIAFA